MKKLDEKYDSVMRTGQPAQLQ